MLHSVRKRIPFGLCLCLIGLGGCSGDGQSVLTGEVTLDGQPLKEGLIKFIPLDGKTTTADAVITDGRFTATVPVGEKRVEISAPKVVGKTRMMPESPEKDIIDELLPERYNAKSDLKMTVERGPQTKKFELKSK
jgi:hypothetical protein